MIRKSWLLPAFICFSAAACSDGSSRVCQPTQQEPCTCPNGAAGTRGCASDGSAWEECRCCQPACQGKACGDDGCGGSCGACQDAPAPVCMDEARRRWFEAPGQCDGDGQCQYSPQEEVCPFGCSEGACQPDPCLALDCSTPSDACHAAGSCERAPEPHCVFPAKENGAPCDDGLFCNGPETCQDGLCQQGTPVSCAHLDEACRAGVCDEDADECRAVNRQDGTACDDGTFCNGSEGCADGACQAGTPVDCSSLDTDCRVGVCNEPRRRCEAQNRASGTPCPDGIFCNGEESCQAGVCRPGAAVSCSHLDGECLAGVCDEANRVCTVQPVPDGGPCDDGDACTAPDTCLDQLCRGGPQICDRPTVIMIYMAADNDLDPDSVTDTNEMKAANVDNVPWLRVYVLWDRRGNNNSRFYQVHNGAMTQLAAPRLGLPASGAGEVNMAHPDTLQKFIGDVHDREGNADYYLVMWDHGNGWYRTTALGKPRYKELCYDEQSNYDSLTTAELRQGIAGQGLRLLGIDACIQGLAEIAYEIRNEAEIMVASEELEPVSGWSYTQILTQFGALAAPSPREFGRIAVDTYIASAAGDDSLTLSVIDLSRMDALAAATSAMADLLAGFSNQNWNSLCGQQEWFGIYWGDNPHLADLYRLAQTARALDTSHAAVYDAVLGLFAELVPHAGHLSSHPNAHGLAVYFPCRATLDAEYTAARLRWVADTTWRAMLQAH